MPVRVLMPVASGDRPTAARVALASTGNALSDGRRGWFIGQFCSAEMGLRRQQALEIKWGQHQKGDRRQGYARLRTATTISILVSGVFVLRLRNGGEVREILLRRPGDYAIYGPGVAHSWEALEDCVVISVRFPSIERDQVELPPI